MYLFSNFLSEYCVWNFSSHLQSGWRGRPSLPTGLTSTRDQRGTHQSKRFRLWLSPSEAQCPGQTGTNTRCLAAAGTEPPWSHIDTPEPTCWSKFFHFSETQTFSWVIQHRKVIGCHLLTCRHFWWGNQPGCRGRWSLYAWSTTLHFLSKTSWSGRTNSVCIRNVKSPSLCVLYPWFQTFPSALRSSFSLTWINGKFPQLCMSLFFLLNLPWWLRRLEFPNAFVMWISSVVEALPIPGPLNLFKIKPEMT